MKSISKAMTKILFILFSALSFLLLTTPILAQTFNSNSYQIQWGNFNMTSGRKTSSTYILTDTVGQNAPGKFDSAGYILKSGAQYAYDQMYKFSFAIDNLDLNFGALVPNVGSTQTNKITVSTPSSHGYQIMAFEDHPLNSFGTNATIPDTTCDATNCSEAVSGVWTGTSAYGFGFNAIGINSSNVATGVGTSSIFTNSNYFRQFSNYQSNEYFQTIMTESRPVKDHSARITYRVLISPNQSAGEYQNSINFIAVPLY